MDCSENNYKCSKCRNSIPMQYWDARLCRHIRSILLRFSGSYWSHVYYETHTGTRLSAIYIPQYIKVKDVYFNKTIQHRMASEREHHLGLFASWNLNTSYRTWPHFYNMFITYTCKHWKLAVALSCTGSFHAGPRCSQWQQIQLHDGHSAPVNDNDSTMTS